MAAKPVKVAFLADTADLRSSLAKAEASMDGAAATAKTAGQKIDTAFDSTAESADRVASKGSQAAGALAGLGDLVGGKFGAAMQAGGVALQAAADGGDLLNVVTESNIIRKIKDTAVTVGQTAATWAKTAADKAAAIGARAWAAGQWVLNAALNANPIGLLVAAIALAVGAIVLAYKKSDTFRAIVQKAFAAVKVAGAVLKAGLVAGFHAIVAGIQGVMSFVGSLKSKVSAGFSAIVDYVASVPGRIIGMGSKFLGAGKAIIGKLVDGLKSIGGAAGSIAAGIGNALLGMVNKIIDALNWAIPNKLGWGKLSIDIADNPIPHVALANGGVTTGPMMALIGDNPGGREAVIPLDKYNLGGNVNLYVEVAPFTNPVEVGRQIVKALDAYRGTGGAVPV